ncbi:hypothetical protein PQR65_03695 [Paraburkholderia nemoris]|uniref:hypothetical protein n=1 Tax=Paraburkholderia nemoris TaxID=2793076 RepID=UPI0038B80969
MVRKIFTFTAIASASFHSGRIALVAVDSHEVMRVSQHEAAIADRCIERGRNGPLGV